MIQVFKKKLGKEKMFTNRVRGDWTAGTVSSEVEFWEKCLPADSKVEAHMNM